MVEWLEDRGIEQMAHLLVGPNIYYPEWFVAGTYSNEQLDETLEDFIRAIMQSNDNGQKVEVWNVVNESLDFDGSGKYHVGDDCKWAQLGFEDDASGLTGDEKINEQHPVYLRKAFEYARKYTNNKLELRDTTIEFPSDPKHKAFYQLVKHLLNQGVPLDAVGIQSHYDLNRTYDWAEVAQAIEKFTALGVEVYITELDIGDTELAWDVDKAQRQKEMYYEFTKAVIPAGIEKFHFWGVRDDNDLGWRFGEHPLLYYEDYTVKPAYSGVLQAIKECWFPTDPRETTT